LQNFRLSFGIQMELNENSGVTMPEKTEIEGNAVGMISLTSLLCKAAEEFPNQRAIAVSGKYALTHSQLQATVSACAARLRAAGVGHGDVVGLAFPNSIEVNFI